MKFQRSVLTGATLALAFTSMTAHAAEPAGAASKLSLSRAISSHQIKRAAAPAVGASRVRRDPEPYLLGATGVGLAIFGLIKLLNNSPSSP